jgi:hypothetical protein
MPERGEPKREEAELDDQLLEPDQLVSAKEKVHLGRRRLSPAILVLLWALRAYVIFMVVVIATEVARVLR